jgi:hypothetical protein
MFRQQSNQLAQTIKAIYNESKISELLKVSVISHEKIIYTLVQQVLKRDLFYNARSHQSPQKNHGILWLILLALIFNLVNFVITILKYSFIPLLYRVVVRNPFDQLEKTSGLSFVFLNSAGGVDRLLNVIQDIVQKEKYVMYYLFTRFPCKIFERSRKAPNTQYLQPHLPDKKAISGCLQFLFKNGHHFTSRLFRQFEQYPLSIRIYIVSDIIQYIYSLIIYYYWAKKMAYRLSKAHPCALFVFDLDEASKELMLSDLLNQLGKRTLLIQHGILTDAKRYLPTCLYMACASERERQSLISEGVNQKRLFVIGQALQTINDSLINPNEDKLLYPVLILAGVGPIWLQNLYVNMLKYSQCLKSYGSIFLRFHPAMGSKSKRLWNYTDRIKITNTRETLGECISRSQLIVTFSIDALTVSVRQYRPTIVCIPEKFFVPEWHDFMLSLPMVRVVKNSELLDNSLLDSDFRSMGKNHFTDKQLQYVDYAFGELDTKNALKSLLSQLS